ncbi:hypothetical protein BCV72DRAFT_220102 [Rhizopus microsporus var. microsporus]|uniref:Transposase n=2 Tax=Rhizopus microsporus TaxID=58291 RepID=A0A2G4SJN6_RHIZD|nr:uncharacterized protein RHIMIDRAFT_267352 [Rhizopus microsporus ATCC 52813]ORE11232.1 hypothetical protein BCV72DRAFT_220102 [Rhizopus microsporus var. microsporus]PHZ08987.1 hypothetical protein RHIMIDRAFT_267352 [Rhizopus microsporus ATCC 52813]
MLDFKPSKLYAFIYSYTLQDIYQKKGIKILVDEYRTSRVCSHCKNDLEDITVPERGFDCNHKYANIIYIHNCTRY